MLHAFKTFIIVCEDCGHEKIMLKYLINNYKNCEKCLSERLSKQSYVVMK